MEEINKTIPYSQQAEQAVLSSLLFGKDAIATAIQYVKAEDFYHSAHAEIFYAVLDLFNLDTPVDMVTLSERLKNRGSFDGIGMDYLLEIANATSTAGGVKYYADIVRENAMKRRLITACEEIMKDCYLGEGDTTSIIDLAEQRVFEIGEKKDNKGFVPINEVLSITYEQLVEASERDNTLTGITTGFSSLDSKLHGLHKQNFILIAARPSMGKTSLAMNMAVSAASKSKLPVAVFSLEMSKEELVNRMWSCETLVDSQKIQTGDLEDKEWAQLMEGLEILADVPIYIDDTGGTTVSEIRAKSRRLKMEKGLGLIIIDHIQLMNSGRRSDNRQQEITDISRNLKLLAKDLDVPVITLAQLNRAAESRTDKRPMLSDLRESGAIEQDADVVLMIYREDYYNKDCERPGIAECIITKNRAGETGTVELKWQGQYTRFSDLETRYDSEEN